MNQHCVLWLLALSATLLSPWTIQAERGHITEPPDRANPAVPNLPETAQLTKIEPALLKQVLEGNLSSQFHLIVELIPQADLAMLPTGIDHSEYQHQVVATLQATARQSQADLLAFLKMRQAQGQVQQLRPFWIINGLAVTTDAQTLLALTARPEVRMVRQDSWHRWLEPSPLLTPDESSVEWNIARVRADQVWSALGVDGSGVTVAIMDSGVDWQHPALQSQYRGYKPGGLAIHEGNWVCTTDEGYLYPVDAYGHGTHVAGIAVGSHEAPGQGTGVAPGAQWVGVKMLNDSGYGYDSWIHAAFEWVMAPAGDPALAPDVVNGSWGRADDADETFRADLQALRAAGIVPVFAAGNEGPNGSSLRSPGSYPEAIAVGATDDLDQVTSFSSRGPSPWGEVKPEVVAPGAQIRSSLPGGTYGVYKGTSMAAPHVTGLVALMLQADPTLTVDHVEDIVTSTALSLGDEVPNSASGWGRIDAYRAAAVAFEAGFIAGQVTRHPDQQPLPTAQVTAYDHLDQPQATVLADQVGRYHLALPPGQYDLKADAFGYAPHTVAGVQVQATLTNTLDIQLIPLPSGVLWGQVSNAETSGPLGAHISAVGTPSFTTSDPQTGQYSLTLPPGSYTIVVTQNGYRRYTAHDVQLVAEQATRLDLVLVPAPTLLLVDSGRWYYGSQASYFEQALDDGDYVYDVWEIRDSSTDLPDLDDLGSYEITVWSSPLDAPGLIGAGNTISNYLGTGGNLFLTGQDIGYWDGGLSGLTWHDYYGEFLKAKAVADDAGRTNIAGLPDDILHGLSLPMNGPDSADNQVFPDSIALLDPRDAAIIGRYQDDGDAALRASGCNSYRAVYLAAGLEGLGDQTERAEVMDRSLAWLDMPNPDEAADLHPAQQDKVWLEGTAITYTVELRNTGLFTDQFTLELSPSVWPTSVWDGSFSHPISQSMVLGVCQTQTLGLRISIPPEVTWNVSDSVTLTARSVADPAIAAQAQFLSKAPAPILLVDDHRWFDTSDNYRSALEANHFPYDVWRIHQTPTPDFHSPTLQRLRRYREVIWFTAYDWYSTLTPQDEANLATYLDGGGRLLLSSQDYLHTSGFTDFARDYLGVAAYTESLSTTLVLGAVGDPVGDGFEDMALTYPFRNFSDALVPKPSAHQSFWGQHGQPAALTHEQPLWKTAFFAYPLETHQAGDMSSVLGSTVGWLSPLGDSSLTVDQPVTAAGGQLTYSLVIRNTGPALLNSVSLSNSVPFSTIYVPGSLEGPATYDSVSNRFLWNGALAPGEAITVGYTLQLDAALTTGAAVSNVAHLRDESGLALDLVADSRVNGPDLSRSKKSTPGESAAVGQVLTYTLVLQNEGLRATQAQLVDPIPAHTTHVAGSARASSGLITSTGEALFWSGPMSIGHVVTITFPVTIEPSATGLYIYNRASLEDEWGNSRPLEAYLTAEIRIFLPLVFKEP